MEYHTFGCEFEFSTPHSEMISIVKRSIKEFSNKRIITQINNSSYFKSNNNKSWHLKTDSSTESEICTPLSTIHDIKTICDIISSLDIPIVTENDAFHIHCDIGDIPTYNIITGWISIESTIFKCFPKHRKNNSYCERLLPPQQTGILALKYKNAKNKAEDKDSVITTYMVPERKTIEIRIGEGTKDPIYIKNWIMFSQYFLNYARNIDIAEILCRKNNHKKIDWLIKEMKIDSIDLKKWLQYRYEKYHN
jgi:hypothetical protein